MVSIYIGRKLIFLESVLRIRKPCTMSTATFFKSDQHNKSENQSSNSKSFRKPPNFKEESDQFGTLKTSLENSLKYKRNSTTNLIMREKKKIIKLKKTDNPEADVFGNLSEINPVCYSDFNEDPKVDNDLNDDSTIVKNFSKKYRCPRVYLSEMKRLVGKRKIKDALDLFVDMKRNFVTPEKYHYTYMIGVCGRIGYTEMAFKLLRQMTDRSYRPTCATLTGLFNACAEGPFPEYGLKKARVLKEKIEEKNWQLSQITYHAMIKAFGKCGDLSKAFKIVDEMAKNDIKIDVATYNFLLMSCISNKEAGFTYAVEVWRKMQAKKCKPDVFTCNLLLRATRDCGVGPEQISCNLLQHWSSYSKRPYGFMTKESLSKEPILKLNSGMESVDLEPSESIQDECYDLESKGEKLDEFFDKKQLPSYELENVTDKSVTVQNSKIPAGGLLSNRPIDGPEILEIINIKSRSDRLSLIGGMKGFLEHMHNAEVKPEMKTLTLLLDCLPDNSESEEELLSIIDQYQMKPDIEFFNSLIKKRHFRKDTEAAKDVLFLMNKYELAPDIMTFGALALGCRTLTLASAFIDEMKKFGSSINVEIAGSLTRQACLTLNFHYMKYVLNVMEEQDVKPDEKVLSVFEKTLADTRKNIILKEQGKEVSKFYKGRNLDNLRSNFKEFVSFYEEWLKRMKFNGEVHPWIQYKTDIIDRVKEEQFIH